MNVTSLATNSAQQQLEAVLHRLTEQVRPRIPQVQCRIHHGANDHFAWWVVGRLSNPADESKVVDVSIECRATQPRLEIQTDLAREDGTVLREYSGDDLEAQQPANANGAPLENALRGIESFLMRQEECLVAELG